MHEYTRTAFYYETDKMGVVHHSNYVRWLEEARTSFFDSVGLPYSMLEDGGVLCPVIDMSLKYKYPARFGDSFTVRLKIIKYTGVRFRVSYTVVNQDGKELLEAESGHAFIDTSGKPVSLAKVMPEKHTAMGGLVE